MMMPQVRNICMLAVMPALSAGACVANTVEGKQEPNGSAPLVAPTEDQHAHLLSESVVSASPAPTLSIVSDRHIAIGDRHQGADPRVCGVLGDKLVVVFDGASTVCVRDIATGAMQRSAVIKDPSMARQFGEAAQVTACISGSDILVGARYLTDPARSQVLRIDRDGVVFVEPKPSVSGVVDSSGWGFVPLASLGGGVIWASHSAISRNPSVSTIDKSTVLPIECKKGEVIAAQCVGTANDIYALVESAWSQEQPVYVYVAQLGLDLQQHQPAIAMPGFGSRGVSIAAWEAHAVIVTNVGMAFVCMKSLKYARCDYPTSNRVSVFSAGKDALLIWEQDSKRIEVVKAPVLAAMCGCPGL